ncbi:MAG TPA: trypsin-like peptidase domain-containing protein [Luteolibacter sp.]|nr:trypsin-like peptidase domain-containing protein [Luteolibacter sp.]
MNAGFRRLLALVAVFAIAFIAVSALRIWRSGGDFRSLVPWFSKSSGTFRPETFTLPEKAPLEIGDVELLGRLNDEYARLTRAVVPSVVSINTEGLRTERLLDIYGRTRIRRYPTQGQGSGVIVSKEGHIVTNHHVIAGQQKIQVTLHGGKSYSATLIGEDNLLDIAVLKIQSDETFTPLKLGDSSTAQVGQLVFAVGNPFGLGETITQGIISAKERSISDNQPDLIQTDAAINPGNSGGPLVNLRGEIIGINVAIYSQDRENPGFQGVGFSIPANDVKDALVQILERGRPVRGFLGVAMHDLDASVRASLNYSGEQGVAVGRVTSDSPAQAAGLQAKDIILNFNSQPIRSASQLVSLVQRSRIGDKISLKIWRDGTVIDIQATIAEAPATPVSSNTEKQQAPAEPGVALDTIGIKIRDLTAPEAIRGYQGIVVTHVKPDSAADRKMLPNDLILAVNHTRVSQANELLNQLSSASRPETTTFHILRAGNSLQVEIPPSGK